MTKPTVIEIDQDLKNMFDATPVAMVLSTPDGQFEYVNPALLSMLGYSEQEIYLPEVIISHPDDTVVNAKLRQQLKDDPFTPISIEKRYIHKSGQIIPGLLTMVAQPDEQHQVKRFIAQIVDLTERKKIENSRKLFRALIDHSSDSILVIDPVSSAFIDANSTACQELGYSHAEITQLGVIDIEAVIPDGFSWQHHVNQVKLAGSMMLEGVHKRKDNSTYPAEISVNYVAQDEQDYMIAIVRNISERKASEQLIWRQANFDNLTGLANRGMLQDRLNEAIKKGLRDNSQVAVLCLDLDHFKDINDSFGHSTGDELLIEAAARIQQCVRDTDTVARIGGDEFAIVIAELDSEESVINIANKIISQLSEPYFLDHSRSYVSASIGIAIFPKDTDSAEILLKQADQAMYVAKKSGRKQYHVFNPEIQQQVDQRAWLHRELRAALSKQQFYLVYQPIIDLASHQCHAAEALIRWQHPERGFISPLEFIAVAEENGLIHPIGDWVFKQVSNQISEWRASLTDKMQVSINTSPLQLRQSGRGIANWCQWLAQINLASGSIIIEVTEGSMMDIANSNNSDALGLLRDRGMQIAIDDFGTGYSSLAYLKRLDIDYVKIDQSFVHNLSPDSDDIAICEAIIVMAHKLNLKVIAEGIETQEQALILKQIGCDFGQGYYFSKGVIASEFEHYVSSINAS